MQLIVFKFAVVSSTADGELLVALMDGEEEQKGGRCVGLISCRPQTFEAMCAEGGSILKEQGGQ